MLRSDISGYSYRKQKAMWSPLKLQYTGSEILTKYLLIELLQFLQLFPLVFLQLSLSICVIAQFCLVNFPVFISLMNSPLPPTTFFPLLLAFSILSPAPGFSSCLWSFSSLFSDCPLTGFRLSSSPLRPPCPYLRQYGQNCLLKKQQGSQSSSN